MIVFDYEGQYSIESHLTADNYESHAEDGHNDEENHQVGLQIGRIFSLYSHLMVIIVWTKLESWTVAFRWIPPACAGLR